MWLTIFNLYQILFLFSNFPRHISVKPFVLLTEDKWSLILLLLNILQLWHHEKFLLFSKFFELVTQIFQLLFIPSTYHLSLSLNLNFVFTLFSPEHVTATLSVPRFFPLTSHFAQFERDHQSTSINQIQT